MRLFCISLLPILALSAAEPADLVVSAGAVLTMDATGKIVRNGAVAVRGGRILAVGPAVEITRRFRARRHIRRPDALLTPGLINGHTHAPMSLLRGIADDAAALDLPARLQRRTRGFVRLGRAVPDRVLDRALAHAAPSRERFDEFFSRYDLAVTPTVARPPVAATEWEGTGALRTLFAMGQVYPFTIAWNHLDLPALALPAGIAGDGLPRSVQLVAPRGAESLLMRVGAEIEAALGLADPPPRPPLAEDGVAARVRAARG